MKKNFIVNLKKIPRGESYENEGKNVAQISIQIPSNEKILESHWVNNPHYRVEIRLSKDARLRLGIELIRSALGEEKTDFSHLYPSGKGNVTRNLGIYLHPQSCELLVTDYDFDVIEEEIEKAEKEKSAS